MRICKQFVIIFNIVLTVTATGLIFSMKNVNSKMVISQYYSPNSIYESQFFPMDLELSVLTHLNYGPFGLTKNCNVVSMDKYADYEITYPRITTPGNLGAFAELKQKHSNLKVLISVGGIQHSKYFSMCAENRLKRMQMIEDITKILKRYRFNGVNYDLEFPTNKISEETDDYFNFLHLLRETRQHFDRVFDRKMLITITGSMLKHNIMKMRNVMDELVDLVDHVNLMTLECGQKMLSKNAKLDALLFNEHESELNIHHAVNLYMRMGLPSNKMVLGLAAYEYILISIDGRHHHRDGEVEMIEKKTFEDIDLEEDSQMSKRIVIPYDNEKSVALKTRFVLDEGLAGVVLYQASDVGNHLIQSVLRTMNKISKYNHHVFSEDM